MPKNNEFNPAIKAILYFMAFLVPIFFLPITLEPFEFNKMYLITGLTGVILVLWAIQVFTQKELQIAKTKLLVPGLLLISSVLASTIFSIDKTSSIFGASGRWYPSLASFLTLGVLYIIISTFITQKGEIKNLLLSLFSGVTVSTIVATASFFGLLFIEGTDKNFNPTGSLLTLGILAVLAIIFTLYTQLTQQILPIKVVTALAFIPNFFYVMAYDNTKVWILLGLGIFGIGASLGIDSLKTYRLNTLIMGILATLILGLSIVPMTNNVIMKHTYPKEIQLPFKESWNIAISTMRDFPLAGTGPSTFYLNYPRYKSLAMNQTENWDLRFDKPHNEALLTVSSLGILGILASGYFVVCILKALGRTNKNEKMDQLVTLLTAVIFLTMFLTHETVSIGFVFTVLLGILGAIENTRNPGFLTFRSGRTSEVTALTPNENEGFLTAVLALPLLALAGLAFITIYKVYPSEYYMQQAVSALTVDAGKSYELQTKAIKLNPRRSNYYNTFAQTNLAIAINLSSQGEELTEEETQTLQNLVATAINASKASTESINPLNPVNWEVQAGIYRAIREATQDADQWAIRALEAAIQLDPANPRLRLELGGTYYAMEDYANAASLFRQAINLKADYANAYYNFAQAAKNLEDFASAKRALELTLSIIDRESEDADKVRQEIEELNEKLASLGEAAQKPTVEELANQAEIAEKEESGQLPVQEPLMVEGEREDFVEPLPEENLEEGEFEGQPEGQIEGEEVLMEEGLE